MAYTWSNGLCQCAPSVLHMMIVVFLQRFSQVLLVYYHYDASILAIMIKNLLASFFAVVVGKLSDAIERKFFLLVSVIVSGIPILLLYFSPNYESFFLHIIWNYDITLALAFAYAADINSEEFGLKVLGLKVPLNIFGVITLASLGAHFSSLYVANNLMIAQEVKLGAGIEWLNVIFITVFVPESRIIPRGDAINPIGHERSSLILNNKILLLICIAIFLAEVAGHYQYDGFYMYLSGFGFGFAKIDLFELMRFVVKTLVTTAILTILVRTIGSRKTFVVGLVVQTVQAVLFGFAQHAWMIWVAGVMYSFEVIPTSAIATYIATTACPEKQGFTQGLVRGAICLARAVAIMSYEFVTPLDWQKLFTRQDQIISGPPFLLISAIVFVAVGVACFIPEYTHLASNEPVSQPQLQSEPLYPVDESLELKDLENSCTNSS